MAPSDTADSNSPSAGEALASHLATLLIGAAIGAAAALLLAPSIAQGKRTRTGGVARNWKSQAADALSKSQESVVSAVEAQVTALRGRSST